MNILYFIPDLPQSWGGVRQYAITLLNIFSGDESNTYFVYHDSDDAEIATVLNASRNLQLINDGLFVKRNGSSLNEKGKAVLNRLFRAVRFNYQFKFEPILTLICRYYKIDVIHCPYQYVPVVENVKLISTMHDVQEMHFPEFFSPEVRLHRASIYCKNLKYSDKIVVSYNHVKNDLTKYFQIPAQKIYTLFLSMDNLWYAKYTGKSVDLPANLRLPEKYVLYPANTWEHKNHLQLLQAIKNIKDEHGLEVCVVCTGHLTEHYYEVIQQKAFQLGVQDQVKFLGVVEEETLYALYNSCVGVVVPTKYEAGSFPLMESILMKIPVICSNVTSLPETVGDANFIFDPYDASSIAGKLKQLWESDEFRKLSVENSCKRERCLTETNALQKIRELYGSLATPIPTAKANARKTGV